MKKTLFIILTLSVLASCEGPKMCDHNQDTTSSDSNYRCFKSKSVKF